MSGIRGDRTHLLPLDRVIATMRETGRDMSKRDQETSVSGLGVQVEC